MHGLRGVWLSWLFLAIPGLAFGSDSTGRAVKVALFGLLQPQGLTIEGPDRTRDASLLRGSDRAQLAIGKAPIEVMAIGEGELQVKSGSHVASRGQRLAIPRSELLLTVTGLSPRPVVGALSVTARRGKLQVILELTREELACGVALCEREPGSWLEALKAQVVASGSYIEANLGRHASEGYDYCDTTHCQRFAGWSLAGAPASAADRAALESVSRQSLRWRGRPVNAYCTADCGGRSALPSQLWGGSLDGPHAERDDPACGRDSGVWSVDLPTATLARAIREAALQGGGRQLPRARLDVPWAGTIDLETGAGGIVREFTHRTGLSRVHAPFEAVHRELRRLVGRWPIPGRRFRLERKARSLRLSGRGRGHHVGLCQRGAAVMALAGRSYREILAAYFPGAELAGE